MNAHEYAQDPDNQQSPNKGKEDGEETEFDKEEDPVPNKSSKPETTLRKSKRLAKEKKKPVEEKKYTAKEKGISAEDKKYPHSENFQPSVWRDHLLDKFERAEAKCKKAAQNKKAIAKLERAEAKWKEATGKVAQLEDQLKEAAIMLCCKPESVAAEIKEKLRICNMVEDFQIQAKKDRQKIAEYKKERSMLRIERAMLLT